ncbi:MAG: hypothetical protein B7X44_10690, partial [Halothiobacillus sp. 15-55-196]
MCLKEADRTPVSAEQMEISRLRTKLARVKMERDILEKGEPKSRTSCECLAGERVLRQGFKQGRKVKYAFIQRHCTVWPISVQCRVLNVSVSGYHGHLARQASTAPRRYL